VFDEAQLVGGGLSATAQMARQLQTAHRWAVTGTPIGAGVCVYICVCALAGGLSSQSSLLSSLVANIILTAYSSCSCGLQLPHTTASTRHHLCMQQHLPAAAAPSLAGGLDDVASLLRLVGAEPFNDDRIFKHVVAEPFKASAGAAEAALRCEQQQQQQQQVAVTSKDAGTQQSDGGCLLSSDTAKAAGPATMQQYYGATARDGVRRLLALLQPLMWRSSKESAAADHPLPPRCDLGYRV
jgi:hypothetical protein